MDQLVPPHSPLQNIALIGNFLPRRCGIATFTTDLLEALSQESPTSHCFAVVMNDVPGGYSYPDRVRFEVYDKRLYDYQLAADFLNVNQVNVTCLQHEFGIFGGRDGTHLLRLIRSLRMPLVTTLHTVLAEPSAGQRAVVDEIAQISERMIVMSRKAREILLNTYGIPPEKIEFIYHGIPDVPFVDPNYYKDQFAVEGKKVILTFGLLSPGKGIEYVIEALPEIVAGHPDVVYIVLGATHPTVLRESGEAYRHSLQRQARELGVEKHVIFHNRFVTVKELCEFLGACDMYVTPYLAKEQIVSGTLSYALGAGKPVVSTPYWYAKEMLADGRGRIVPFRDSRALAEQVIDLLDHEVERHAMRKRAYGFCRNMIWKEVARQYLAVFAKVQEEREHKPARSFGALTLQGTQLEMPQIKLDHLQRLTDDVGMLQHAMFIVPNRSFGYCTDDNARALVVVLLAKDLIPNSKELLDLECRYLSFLYDAFDKRENRFRNFLDYDRTWKEEQGSEDSQGRAVWALGVAVALEDSRELAGAALDIFEKAVRVLTRFPYPRPWAFALTGIHAYLKRFGGDTEMKRHREKLAGKLFGLYRSNATDDWPWIEETATYDNGKIAQALIQSGNALEREDMLEAGLKSLEWLLRVETDPRGHIVPIGNHGWYPRGGYKARFDQQPIEAESLLEACVEAYYITGEKKWANEARRCFEWFLGRNDMNTPLYDYRTGGCRDGLEANGVNANQGAESTLAWLLSLINMHILEGYKIEKSEPEATPEENMLETKVDE